MLLTLAAWAWLDGAPLSLGPDIPAFSISYLARPGPGRAVRPDGVAGMLAVSPAAAEAVQFTGGFDIGATAALEAALAKAPHARLVAFDSPGGRPLAAEGVAEVIQAHHVDTTVSRYCASACTIAYLAGAVRTAAPDARFAFHLGTGPVLASLSAAVVLQIERRWFIRGGASLSFAERALHAPNLAPYTAPVDELMAAGYVNRMVPVPPAAAPGTALLRAVAAIEPQTAAALLWGQAQRRMPVGRSAAITAQRAGLVVDRWLRHSSDRAVLSFVTATLDVLHDLQRRDPAACVRWQIGLTDQDAAAALISPRLLAAYREAQIQVLRDANAYPVPTPADGDGRLAGADRAVRRDVAAAYGERALAEAGSREHAFDEPGRSCAASIAYLAGLRTRPGGARLLRWALAAG